MKEAKYVTRLNRFAASVVLQGERVLAHVANSGRLRELLQPENTMLLTLARLGRQRKTAYDLTLVGTDGVLVSVDARLPNGLLREAIEAGRLPQFRGYRDLAAEVPFHDSRIDLMLSDDRGRCYVEAKSVTLVENGVGLFPDAPTERGRKHLGSLVQAARAGHRAAVVFVVQRPDARSFSCNYIADPQFCGALTEAASNGVEAYAYGCRLSRSAIDIGDQLPFAPAERPGRV